MHYKSSLAKVRIGFVLLTGQRCQLQRAVDCRGIEVMIPIEDLFWMNEFVRAAMRDHEVPATGQALLVWGKGDRL